MSEPVTLSDDVATASGVLACLTLLQSVLVVQLRAEPQSADLITGFALAALRESNSGETERHRATAAMSEMLVTTAVQAASIAAKQLVEGEGSSTDEGPTRH